METTAGLGGRGQRPGVDKTTEAAFRFSPRPNRAAQIAWRPFGRAAFDEAARLGRPVLLSIGAVWCHWCHVMDETSYSDEGVLALIDAHYVAVRVDRDQRPDVDRRYNQGGWPSTCVLNAAGAILWGAAYVPPDRMVQVLSVLAERYRADPALARALPGLGHDHDHGPGAHRQRIAASVGPGGDGDGVVEALLTALVQAEDRVHGGFGTTGPKFPQVEALGFLAVLGDDAGETGSVASAVLHRALEGMRAGALEDPIEGGFYRYATRPDWTQPHFEKMLGDNAALAALYLGAAARTGDNGLRRAGERAVSYMNRVLWQPHAHAYGASQDADEGYARLDAGGRAAMAAPYVDPVIYCAPNADMVETLLLAWAVLGDDALLDRAFGLWDGLCRRFFLPGAGMAHHDAGDGPVGREEPADQAAALGAVAALLPWGRTADAAVARDLAEYVLGRLVADDGALAEAAGAGVEDGPEVFRALAPTPLVQESGKAAAALLQVGRQLHEPRYVEAAARMVAAFSGQVAALGTFAGAIGRAAVQRREPVEVTVAEGAGGPPTEVFFAAALRSGVFPLVLTRVATADRRACDLPEAARTVAYPCRLGVCLWPVGEPALLPAALGRLARTGDGMYG